MWIFTSDSFLSIVHKNCAPDELMVRARRDGDIEALFPNAKVQKTVGNDYLYRARIKRDVVAAVMIKQVEQLKYDNFKNSIRDDQLHNAASRVWSVMAATQAIPPYSAQPTRKQGNLL